MSHEWTVDDGEGLFTAAGRVDAQLEALLAAESGPVRWRTVTAVDARDRWDELRQWVRWFRREFAFDHRVVPPCWYRHTALVSVLSALRDHWVCAYDPANTPIGASDWHRALMQLEPRLREWAARTGCSLSVHRPDVLAELPDDTQAWKAHVDADVVARRARDQQAADECGTQQSGLRFVGRSS